MTRSSPKGGIEVIFKDRGRGIPSDVLARLFKDVIKKNSADSKGLGIGLLMAQAIVEAYRGRLYVAETSAEGTSMTMWFPEA